MKKNNLEVFKKDFERDVLVKIVISLRHGKMTKERSRDLARGILNIFKNEKTDLVFEGINRLSQSHPDILDIFINRGYEYDEREKEEKLNQIVLYFKGGEN
jgi:hypothetical protein